MINMLFEIMGSGHPVAWTTKWTEKEYQGHKLVAVPVLRLDHSTTSRLAERRPYNDVFADKTIEGKAFLVLHADFALFKTGEPEIENFAAIIIDPSLQLPSGVEVIAETARMLRGDL